MGRGPRIDHIERDAFQKDGRAVVIADGDARRSDAVDALRFVAVGHALPEYEVRLVDDNDKAVGERREGLIEFRGPSATPGYYRNPGATEELKTPDGWTRTGDLGYFAEGDLFITGRRKDLIIKGGRNVYPQEVEAAAGEIDGVRTGCVAAFSIEGEDGGEQLVVVAESRKTEPEELRRLAHEIKRKVNAVVRVAPDRIEMVPPNTIPKTPSGKLRRRETRQRLLDGNLVQPVRSTLRQVVSIGAKGIGQKIRRLFGKGEA